MSRFVAFKVLLLLLLFGIGACSREGRTEKKLAKDTAVLQSSETNLTFNDVTLEQTDEQGRLLWKVKAKQAIYSKDNKIAQVQNPIGDLFQDGKIVYQIGALQGEVHQEGKKIFLKGQIVATDTETGAVFRGNELEWQPKEALLIVRNQLTGTHKEMQMSARELRAFNREKRIELIGQVMAKAKEPPLQMRGEHLTWWMQQQKVISDRPVQIDRYKGQTITDRAVGQQAEVDLKAKTAILKQNAQLNILDPPVQVASNLIFWNVNAETVVSDQPVQVVHREQQVAITANRGRLDLKPEIAYLTGNVRGIELRRQSKLYADQMIWTLPTEIVEATGNVTYQQVDPPLNLTGPKAIGKLKDQTVAVSSGNNSRVVTEIIPEELRSR